MTLGLQAEISPPHNFQRIEIRLQSWLRSLLSAASREKCVSKHRGMPGKLAEMKAIHLLISAEALGNL